MDILAFVVCQAKRDQEALLVLLEILGLMALLGRKVNHWFVLNGIKMLVKRCMIDEYII